MFLSLHNGFIIRDRIVSRIPCPLVVSPAILSPSDRFSRPDRLSAPTGYRSSADAGMT